MKKKDKGGKKFKGEPYDRLSFKFKPAPNGVFMHPSKLDDDRVTSVSYHLGKEFSTFHSQVSLNDSSPVSPSALTLSVFGDEKLLWRSGPINDQDTVETCRVSVKGVDVLKLVVTAEGEIGGAHALWIDPYVAR